jgi:hypothetical protein
VLDALLASALLCYLAVAHHGRGRGAWMAQEPPEAWVSAVGAVVLQRQAALQALWRQRDGDESRETLSPRVQVLVESACAEVLKRLYPQGGNLLVD